MHSGTDEVVVVQRLKERSMLFHLTANLGHGLRDVLASSVMLVCISFYTSAVLTVSAVCLSGG